MSKEIEWRDLQVYRDSKYENLVSRFCATKTKNFDSSSANFKTIKEFMVFAALVGYELDAYVPIAGSKKISITLATYSSTHHDSYIYLIALSKDGSLDALKGENLSTSIKYFEAYCNGGLEVINEWILENLSDDIGSNTIFNKALEYLVMQQSKKD